LLPELKKNLAGYRFASDQMLQMTEHRVLEGLSKDGLFHVFDAWGKRCDKCINVDGGYVEK
jgi:hypothetical protein